MHAYYNIIYGVVEGAFVLELRNVHSLGLGFGLEPQTPGLGLGLESCPVKLGLNSRHAGLGLDKT